MMITLQMEKKFDEKEKPLDDSSMKYVDNFRDEYLLLFDRLQKRSGQLVQKIG